MKQAEMNNTVLIQDLWPACLILTGVHLLFRLQKSPLNITHHPWCRHERWNPKWLLSPISLWPPTINKPVRPVLSHKFTPDNLADDLRLTCGPRFQLKVNRQLICTHVILPCRTSLFSFPEPLSNQVENCYPYNLLTENKGYINHPQPSCNLPLISHLDSSLR